MRVSYYIHVEDATDGVTDPPNAPITVYRYQTLESGLSSSGITLVEQQTNFPTLTEETSPTPGNPWTWTVSALSGFAGAPSVWFEYQDADQTVADLHWSGFESSDWLSGVDGDFSLTLSNGVDANIEYTLYLSLRSLLYDGLAVFEKQTAGGAMITTPGLYGFDITADNFDWGGSLPPTAASLTMDADGKVTGHDFGDGPWNLDGTFRLKLQDGARPISYVPGQALALRQLLPDTLTVINEGTSGNAMIQVDGVAEMWDWSVISDGLPVSEIGAANANSQATLTLTWIGGGLMDGETGTGSISLIRSDGSAPESFVALPIVIEAANCCVGRVGDANSSGDDEPTIGDISVLIDAKFIAGTCDGIISCLDEADINQSGVANPTCDDITIGDISILIDYLFITGPSLGLPDCM
jgi:hypothetical protein